MTLNDFQRLTIASMGAANMIEHVRAGVLALGDHVDEAKDAARVMEKAETSSTYVDARERLVHMLGFVLVDVAEICEGLDVLMADVAMENLCELVRIRKMVDKDDREEMEEKCKESVLGRAVALLQGMLDGCEEATENE